jgi:hypothetical protein
VNIGSTPIFARGKMTKMLCNNADRQEAIQLAPDLARAPVIYAYKVMTA